MKSRVPIFILSLAVAVSSVTLGACSKNETESAIKSEIPTSSDENYTDENSSEIESELSDDVKRLIKEYPCVLEFTGDDGMVLPLSDITNIEFPSAEDVAIGSMDAHVTYELAYMSYGLPIFATMLDNDDWKSEGDGFSGAVDWVNYRRDEAEKLSDNHVRFEVRPGDKLENGLVVKSAETVYSALLPKDLEEQKNNPIGAEFNPFSSCKIEFDGTLTLEGVLYKYTYDEDYNAAPNDVFFFPDTTKNKFVLIYGKKEVAAELLSSDAAPDRAQNAPD